MPLVPGPFRLADPADVAITPGVYDFTDDAAVLQGQLSTIGAGWDPLIFDLEAFAATPWDAELAVDLDGMLTVADVFSDALPPANLADALAGWFDSQALLGAATAFAPIQAWTDPGGPFVPPDSALTLVAPTINPTAFTPAQNTVVGQATAGANPAIGLFNLTRIGAQNFTVGDQLEVIALGHEGDDIFVASSLNGVKLPDVDYGAIDGTGQMFIQVTIGPEAIGVWSQQWYNSGRLLGDFNFLVTNS
jgi:hypothetical protein